jgi:deoxyhypusine monooxygenase
LLEQYRDDPDECIEVRETCELSVDRIKFLADHKVEKSAKFLSIDPAPPSSSSENVAELKAQLLNDSLSLFERYRAMFALRDIGNEEAVLALAEGLNDKSALFRHEIGYVFGQLQHPAAVTALTESVRSIFFSFFCSFVSLFFPF